MNNEILIALIEKDSNELSKFFTCADIENLSTGYLQLMLDKSRDLSDNISSLMSNLQNINAGNVDDEKEVVEEQSNLDEHIDSIVSDKLKEFFQSQVPQFVDARLTATIDPDGLIAKCEQLNNSLLEQVRQLNNQLTDNVHNLNRKVDSLSEELLNIRKNDPTQQFPVTADNCVSELQQPSSVIPVENNETPEPEAPINEAHESITIENEICLQDTFSYQEAEITDCRVEQTPEPEEVKEESEVHHTAINDETNGQTDNFVEQQTATNSIVDSVIANSKPTVADTIHTTESIMDKLSNRADNTLASSLNNKKIDDLKSAISIADRFRFQRELFAGDGELMNKTISKLNSLESLAEAEEFIQKKFNWSPENSSVADFLHLLQRRYL